MMHSHEAIAYNI